MRDRLLLYAVLMSIMSHIAVAALVGRTSASRFNTSVVDRPLGRILRVNIVRDPDEVASSVVTKPVVKPKHVSVPSNDKRHLLPTSFVEKKIAPDQAMARKAGSAARIPGNPGGKLNIGSTSPSGDLDGNWSGGRTPVGYVPGGDSSRGIGSGSGPGVASPEPTPNASDGLSVRPAPNPDPEPRRVTVRVCDASGLLAGDYCKDTRKQSFVEGQQPERRCARCKPPEPEHRSILAEKTDPVLIRDSRVSVPSLVPEGMNFVVEIEYTVTESGSVSGVTISRSSGNKAIDRAVLNAASGLLYKPATQGGVPRSVKMSRTYRINT